MPRTVRPQLEIAARRTIAAYRDAGLLGDEHKLLIRLIQETVEAIPEARPGQQRAAMLKELRELMMMLPERPADNDPADEFIAGL